MVNRELQRNADVRPGGRSTRHIEVALTDGMSYRTGDHLAVLPHNSAELVQRVLARFGIALYPFIQIHRNSPGTTPLPLDQPVSVLALLERFVQLRVVSTPCQINL